MQSQAFDCSATSKIQKRLFLCSQFCPSLFILNILNSFAKFAKLIAKKDKEGSLFFWDFLI